MEITCFFRQNEVKTSSLITCLLSSLNERGREIIRDNHMGTNRENLCPQLVEMLKVLDTVIKLLLLFFFY